MQHILLGGGGGPRALTLYARVPTFEGRKTSSQSRHMYKGKLMTYVSYMDNYLNLFDIYCIWGDWVTTMWRDAVLAFDGLASFSIWFPDIKSRNSYMDHFY